ncbi:unnamed protein product, partial [Prorocentrum cordatum]
IAKPRRWPPMGAMSAPLQHSVCALACLAIAASTAPPRTADVRAATGLAELLHAAFPDAPDASIRVSADIGMERAAAKEKVTLRELACERDYSACPSGWADLGDGVHCEAPLGFAGSCDSVVEFGGMAPRE